MLNLKLTERNDFGNEFDFGAEEAEKIHVKLDGTTLTRDPVTGVISSLVSGGGSALLPLPPPHVETLQGQLASGVGRDGLQIDIINRLQVRLVGVPAQYFDPAYQLQVYLFRHVKTRWEHHINGVYGSGEKRPGGMVHPRHEMPNPYFGDQPTVFAFTSLADKEILTIPSQAFTRYFQRRGFRKIDSSLNYVSGITSLMYHGGRVFADNHDSYFYGGRRNVSAIPTKGHFEFRYAITNPADGKVIYSAPSRVVTVHPRITPVIPVGGGTFELMPNPKADNLFVLKIDLW